MWHLNRIPKTVHFYWGGSKLSYLRFLSVESFQRHNPDWAIEVHVPAIPSNAAPAWDTFQQKNVNIEHDYFSELSGIDGVTIVEHDFSDYDFDNNAHEVHKSDFLRWRLLSTEGGVWSDIDILYVKPMNSLVENVEEEYQQSIDAFLCNFKRSSSPHLFFHF
jgi:mannosyltransferase OCH1-like enzyme